MPDPDEQALILGSLIGMSLGTVAGIGLLYWIWVRRTG